jgi:regulator of protease activity HflC (stomatin/prohibitin superfamily)
MFLFILGLIFALVAVLALVAAVKKSKKSAKALSLLVLVVGVCLCFASCIRTVPTGHTGIVTTFGNVEDYTYEAGVHFSAPWHSVINMDNRNQRASVDLLCFSSDIQEVSVTYTLNYQIEKAYAQKIYKEIGKGYYSTVINPRIQEAVKSVLAQYTAEQLLENRAQLSTQIKDILTEKLSAYNVEVLDTSLENLDFSDAFTDAVESKQVAEQKSKQAKIEQEQKTMEAEAEAKRAQIQAEAEAAVAKIAAEAELDVVKIQADAAEYAGQKDAAVIGQIKDILSVDPENMTDKDVENLLLYYYILQWNGEFPATYLGSEEFQNLLTSLTK